MRRPAKLVTTGFSAVVLASILVLTGVIPATSPMLSYEIQRYGALLAAGGPAQASEQAEVTITSHRPLPLEVNLTAFAGYSLNFSERPIYLLEDRGLSCPFGSYSDLVALQSRIQDQLANFGVAIPIHVVDGAQLVSVVSSVPDAVVLDLECGVLPVPSFDLAGVAYVHWLRTGGVLVWAGGPLGFFHQSVIQPVQNVSPTYPGWEGQQIFCGFPLADPTPILNKGPTPEPAPLVGSSPSAFAVALGFQYAGTPYGANLTQVRANGGVDLGIDSGPNGTGASPRSSLTEIPVGNGTLIYFGGALWPFAGAYLANGGTDLGYDLPLLLALGVRPTLGSPSVTALTLAPDGTSSARLPVPTGPALLVIRVDLVQTTPYLAAVAFDTVRPRRRGAASRAGPSLPSDPTMLRATFAHLPEIGLAGEDRLWQIGIRDWATLARRREELGFSAAGHSAIERTLAASERALSDGDVAWFTSRLPPSEQWRLYPAFRSRTAFLDIETTSLSPYDGIVTVVTVHGGETTRSFVADDDLEELPAWLGRYRLLVTFNGRYFDVPYLQYRFPSLPVPPAHIDLRFVLYRLGISGGLKRIEQRLGLGDRTGVEGIAGLEAVHLWARYRAGNADALDRLIDYNRADTVNLEPLTEYAVRELSARLLARGLAAPA